MAERRCARKTTLASDEAGLRAPFRPRMLTRRAFLAASAAAAAGFALPGCSTSKNIVVEDSGAASIDTRLTFFGFKYEPLNVTAIEGIMGAFMDEHPNVLISYEGIKGQAYYDALEKRLASGNGDDVFMVDHDTALAFEEAGHLADLSDLPTIPRFSDLALRQMRADGPILYVPTSISAFGLYCNTDLLARRGLSAPRTLAEFERACDAFVAAGVAPVVANNDISLKSLILARGMAEVYAADDAGERIAALGADPAAFAKQLRPGLELAERLVARGYVDAGLALKTRKTSDDLEQFATGAVPFMLTGAWASVRVHDLAPDLAYEVHPLPVLENGPVLVVNVDTRVSVNASGPHAQAAREFVAFLTQPSSIESFADSQCSFSPLEGNAPPDDMSVQPLTGAFASNVVVGSDDTVRLPVWGALRACAESLLEGASASQAEGRLRDLLSEEAGGAR